MLVKLYLFTSELVMVNKLTILIATLKSIMINHIIVSTINGLYIPQYFIYLHIENIENTEK